MKGAVAFSMAAAVFGLATTSGISQSARAQACDALAVVGGEGTRVTKTVSLPGVLFVDSNWNTDFAIPNGTAYSYFDVAFVSESGESYDIDVNLKYSDESVDQSYSIRDRDFTEGEAVTIRAESRRRSSPYQVNLRIGGINAEGNTYTVAVSGCR